MKSNKTVLTIVAVAILALGTSAQASLLFYEGFDYNAGSSLAGLGTPGGGSGTWFDNSSGPHMTVRANGAPVSQLWTGIPSGGYPQAGGFLEGERTDDNSGHILLATSVTSTFQDGTTTWMSFVSAGTALTGLPDNHHKPNLAVGQGELMDNRAQQANGQAIGGGPRYNTQSSSAAYWDDEDNSGNFEEHRSAGTKGRISPQQLIVIKIEWGTTSDTVSVANFGISTPYTPLTEADFNAASPVSITSVNNLDQSTFDTLSFHGSRSNFDEIRIGTTFDDIVTGTSVGKNPIAGNPDPGDQATDVCRSVVLSWTPGEYADKHDVYFGTDEAKVTDANIDNPLDVLVSPGQTETYYPTVGTLDLDFGQTYYWRVDEVNAPPDPTIFKGDVWQFTIEPIGYPIANVTATASSEYDPTRGPENTVNGSGLVNDLHSNVMADMWLSGSEPAGAWIEYAFDRLYKLHEMWVWNFNDEFNNAYGLKGVTIEYSADGDDWTELAGVPEFVQAEGSPDYAHVTIDFTGVTARYVKITANSNWGGSNLYGLSEVRFLYVPVRAREPYSPLSGTDVPLDVTLNWTAGREAERHDVYLGTDEQAVADGTISPVSIPADDGCVAGYAPLSLELGKTYYWKVNEVNMAEEPNTWEGDIWSFSTPAYFVVDDMTSYGDVDEVGVPDSRIWYTWKDGQGWDTPSPGYGGNGTGSVIELDSETVYDTPQSMAYHYSSNGTNFFGKPGKAYYSESTALISDLVIGNDWTVNGIKSLSLHFYGDPANDAGLTEQMYVKLNGAKVVYDGDANDITEPSWHEWSIDLAVFGINLQNVTEISIGFGNEGNVSPGGLGVVYFDDIRLYPSRCVLSKRSAEFALVDFAPEGDPGGDCVVNYKELDVMTRDWLLGDASVEPVEPNAEGLMVRYEFENNANDSSAKGNHGTEFGYPVYTAGHDGSALQLDGTDDYVNINNYKGILGSEPFSVTAWINTTAAGDRTIASWGKNTNGQKVDFRLQNGLVRIEHGKGNRVTYGTVNDGEWHHVAVVVIENASISYPDVTHYIDGQDDTRTGTDADKFGTVADIDVSIGRRCLNNDRFFEGLIDDVRIYDYTLSQGEIVGAAGEGTLYIPLLSPANIYDSEPENQKKVNFLDYATLTQRWLDEDMFP
ncbi:MAG: discoidin domain-containing protein [Planctomycetes bacterium]|nr:discoidin domain-containing protein [Planctomycetota bacterium]